MASQLRQRDDGEPLQFTDCFRYGTSKQNPRIETWWAQHSKSATIQWRDYFLDLSKKGMYNSNSLADRVALIAIYTPILRQEFIEFIILWNNHRIRKQKKRPYLVAGIPHLLYNYPQHTNGEQCGYIVPPNILQPEQDRVQGIGS